MYQPQAVTETYYRITVQELKQLVAEHLGVEWRRIWHEDDDGMHDTIRLTQDDVSNYLKYYAKNSKQARFTKWWLFEDGDLKLALVNTVILMLVIRGVLPVGEYRVDVWNMPDEDRDVICYGDKYGGLGDMRG